MKRNKNLWFIQLGGVGGKQVTETACERTQMLNLTGKDLKAAIVKLFKSVKETMLKEVEEAMMTLSH